MLTDKRLELHEILCNILGSRQVYFQPPESVRMKYPAIVYSRSNFYKRHANDSLYMHTPAYEVIVIDTDPDSKYVEPLMELPLCTFDRRYVSNNLYHDVFTIYY